jgi:hypothetical protein
VKRALEALGVDYTQWRALARAYFLVDHEALFGAFGHAASVRAATTLLKVAVACGLIGGSSAVFILLGRDLLLSATVMTTTIGLIVAMLVLGQGSMIAAPDDYAIIGFRPVSSRTYFAVRLTAVLGNSVGVAVMCGYLPVAAFFFRDHGTVGLAIAAAAAVLATSLFATFLMVGAYAWLIHIVRPALVTRIIGWVPIVAVLVVAGLFALAAFQFMDATMPDLDLMEGHSLLRVDLPRKGWMLALPPVWFASYVEVARGTTGGFERTAAILSVVAMLGALLLLRGRLSGTFAARLAQISSASATGPRVVHAAPWPWLRGARRALALVMRGQLRDDAAFQTHVAITALVAAGVLISMLWYWMPADPFLDDSPNFLLVMAMGFLGSSFYSGLASSPADEATWPFFTTPTERSRLILAARNITTLIVLVPVALGLLTIFLYAFDHAGHAVVHAAAIAGLAFIQLQIAVILMPAVPFATPVGIKATWDARQFLVAMGPMLLYFALRIAYRSWATTAIGLAAFVVIIAGLERALRLRLAKRPRRIPQP